MSKSINIENQYLTFRPRVENREDWEWIRRWCEVNHTSVSAVLNSLIPVLCVALHDHAEVDHHIGGRQTIAVQMNFGEVTMITSTKTTSQPRIK